MSQLTLLNGQIEHRRQVFKFISHRTYRFILAPRSGYILVCIREITNALIHLPINRVCYVIGILSTGLLYWA